ncbi:MAG: hypothetical protein ACJ76N_29365 [Thermoanaerobaculia bacterium]
MPVHRPPAVQAKPAAAQRILPVPPAIVQCKLGGRQAKDIADIALGGTQSGALTFDDANPQPQQQDLDRNRDILSEACRAIPVPVTAEHLKQVVSEVVKKRKPKTTLRFTPLEVVVHQIVLIEHLDEFEPSSEKFTGQTSAKTVVLLAKVDGMPVTDAPPQESGDAASLRVPPNGGPFAQSSSTDGEVEPLIDTLDKFYVYLEDEANQTANRRFTVAIACGWGACEGCKVRIARFRQLWSAKAAACMQQGTIARLTITYRYKNKPAGVFGGNYYGWGEDAKRDGWYWHTETEQVNGTRQP